MISILKTYPVCTQHDNEPITYASFASMIANPQRIASRIQIQGTGAFGKAYLGVISSKRTPNSRVQAEFYRSSTALGHSISSRQPTAGSNNRSRSADELGSENIKG
jgi:ABC-type Na+ efflux pump permease subunit